MFRAQFKSCTDSAPHNKRIAGKPYGIYKNTIARFGQSTFFQQVANFVNMLHLRMIFGYFGNSSSEENSAVVA